MAGSVNKVILIGNLGADPEIRRTQDGRPIANLRIATSESWRDKATGERKEKTEWHRVVIFNEGLCKIAEQYLKKGAKVYIEGQLQTRKWQDQSGQDKYSTEVVLQGFNSALTMLDGRSGGGGGSFGGSDEGGDFGGGRVVRRRFSPCRLHPPAAAAATWMMNPVLSALLSLPPGHEGLKIQLRICALRFRKFAVEGALALESGARDLAQRSRQIEFVARDAIENVGIGRVEALRGIVVMAHRA